MYYCIVCGEELKVPECPVCGWSLMKGVPETVSPRQAAPTVIPGSAHRPAPEVTSYATQIFIQVVPPLVDFVLHDEGHTYVLSEAIEGKATSLARWGDEGFEGSSMLAIGTPIGLELLDDGSPVIIGGKGTVVNLDFPDETRGHETKWNISCFAINPARNMLSFGVPADRAVKGLLTRDFSENVLMDNLPGNPTALSFSRNGKLLAAGCYSGEICILDTSTGHTETIERPGIHEGVVALGAISDGRMVSAYEDGQLVIWDASGAVLVEDNLDADITTIAVDVETERVAVGCSQGQVYVWEPMLGEAIVNQQVHSGRVTRIVFRRSGSLIVSATSSGEVSVLDLE